jgi:hypothetical protein
MKVNARQAEWERKKYDVFCNGKRLQSVLEFDSIRNYARVLLRKNGRIHLDKGSEYLTVQIIRGLITFNVTEFQ